MSFAIRSYEKELLDGDNVPFADIAGTMKELNVINTLLGGHSITEKGIEYFLNKSKDASLSVAEIGCGGGDNLAAVRGYAQKKQRNITLTGIDIKRECIDYAQAHQSADINWVCSDYQSATWPAGEPDVIFSSLFCHHFTDDQLVAQLQWLNGNSRLGFFINDLQRNVIAYYAIKILTILFSRSYMVKNDGPLSVKRALKRNEWVALLQKAGIRQYTIRWQWAFRFLICVTHE